MSWLGRAPRVARRRPSPTSLCHLPRVSRPPCRPHVPPVSYECCGHVAASESRPWDYALRVPPVSRTRCVSPRAMAAPRSPRSPRGPGRVSRASWPPPTYAMATLQSPRATRVLAVPRPTGAVAMSRSLRPIAVPGRPSPLASQPRRAPRVARPRRGLQAPRVTSAAFATCPTCPLLPAVGSPPSAWASTTSTRGSGARCRRWCRSWCPTPTTTPPPRTTTS